MNTESTWGTAALALVTALWAGVVIGSSFLATPAKFQALSLSLPVALEVGMKTFHVLARAELGLLVLTAAASWFARPAGFTRLLLVLAAIVVLYQQAWLLPQLDERTLVVVQGGSVPASYHHFTYVVAEGLKVLLLTCAAARLMGSLGAPHLSRNEASSSS